MQILREMEVMLRTSIKYVGFAIDKHSYDRILSMTNGVEDDK